ncbi:MAG: TonB-dependent receptor [Ignavibacteriaceae bacterium]|nr:TonB-dependent receptor [Ignavibacteria bacterium]NNJ52525.1 TonB-dependent receptor [Ignavibacteriaceae bacterium]
MEKLKFFFLFAVIISTLSFAQESSVQKADTTGFYNLSDVVISATKTSTLTTELANSISIIDSSEIANKKKVSLFDLLKTEYGLSTLQFGPLGGLGTISIRGSNAGHSLVLIDGVEMNLPSESSNLYDFANLPSESIDKIEILRGPQSTLYGSDALAGVVNIVTKKGIGSPKLLLSAEAGTYDSYKGSAGLSGNFGNLNYLLSFSRTQSDGFSAAGKNYGNTEKDGYEGNQLFSRIGLDFNKNSGLNFYVRFTKANTDLDQFGGEFGDDPTYKYNLEEFTGRAEGFFKLLNDFWEQKIGASFYRNLRNYNYDSTLFNPLSSNSNYDGRKIKIDWQNKFHLSDGHILSFGAETELEQAKIYFYSLSEFGSYESILPMSETYTSGIYLQDQFNIEKRIFATAGIRYDHHTKFGGAFTFRVAPAFIFWESGTKIKATIGSGFKAPSIVYLYDPFFGNENLNPETSIGFDVGVEQFIWSSGISIGLNYFNNDFTDLIGLDENFKSINIDNAKTEGIEFFSKIHSFDFISIKLNYTYTSAVDRSVSSLEFGRKLLRRPTHRASFFADYIISDRANINFELIYVGEKDDKNFSNFPVERIKLNAYTLINIAGHYKLFDFIKMFARVENILDSEYEDVYGYGTPGLSAFAGLKLTIY